MNASCGCQRKSPTSGEAREQNTWLLRFKEVAGWVLPGALLALMPKCPMCLAAYVALCTGFTMSGSSAHLLMRTLTAVCISTLALCVVRLVVNCRNKKHQFNLQSTEMHA
jgi:uncharacterized membrane protein